MFIPIQRLTLFLRKSINSAEGGAPLTSVRPPNQLKSLRTRVYSSQPPLLLQPDGTLCCRRSWPATYHALRSSDRIRCFSEEHLAGTLSGRYFIRRSSFAMGGTVENTEASGTRLPVEAKKILHSLASNWEDVRDPNALQVTQLKGAMTNAVFQIKWPTETGKVSRKVLVRIYGEGVEVFFDRDNEIRTFEFMSKHGQGPRLMGRFSNGRIEEFIHARTLSAADLRDPETSARIASKMEEFHALDMPGLKRVTLWDRLKKWIQTAKDMATPEEAKAVCLDAIEGEIFLLQRELEEDNRIGFCHNDLQYGNIMMDEETRMLTIIDYEYSSYNPIAFDLANHFCEMTADYHTETPHILDYGNYPGLEERRIFVHTYLSSSGKVPGDDEVNQLIGDIEKYTLASHLFWGLWGIISEHVNEIDFDYIEYAKQRFNQYWSRRKELLK
ncbi:hypothetical protein SAY87_011066 [Trapa incisa]|uniref:Choline kinase 2 n=1 Tax=Trapa incisa TaxID=236973 RepID=A0AAN7GMD7_9MYRT|nr:hypothetical protein SAY87_011066 [Trapa incisa]